MPLMLHTHPWDRRLTFAYVMNKMLVPKNMIVGPIAVALVARLYEIVPRWAPRSAGALCAVIPLSAKPTLAA